MIEVELHDGTVLEFPDGTADDVINRVAKRETVLTRSRANIAADEASYNPTSGMSGGERRMAGIGKAFVDTGRGLGQLVGAVSRESVDTARQADAPLMATREGVQGSLLGNLAITAPLLAVPGGASVRGAALIGGGLGAAQPVGTGDSRLMNTALGTGASAATAGVLGGVSRVAKPVTSKLPAVDARSVRTLESAGVSLDAAQKSGSPVLQRVKSALKDNPVTLGGQVKKAAQQQTQFNRAVLRTVGESADVADESTMGALKTRISKTFDDVLSKHSVKPNTTDLSRAAALRAKARRQLADNRIGQYLDDIGAHVKENGGKLDGRFYQNLRSELSALESEKGIAPLARELRENLDDAFQRAAGPDGKRLQEARRQWRNMRIIEKAIDTEGAGNISPAKLANQFGTKANRNVGVYGQGDKSVVELSRLAKAGKRLLPDKLPQSGTAPRAVMQAVLPAAAGGLYGGFQGEGFGGVAAGAAAGLAAPLAAQRLINSPAGANYLTRGLFPTFQESNALLQLRRAAALGAPHVLFAESAQ